MVEEDFGEATIVYEDPDDGTVETTVPNKHVAYFQDHWLVKTGEDEQGRDTVRRIPATRVYHVERTVEEFEEEIRTLTDQVRSITSDLRGMLPVGGDGGRGRRRTGRGGHEREGPVNIEVERGETEHRDDASDTPSSQQ
jgi:hypothetical protein